MRVARTLLATGVVVLVVQSLADLVASLGFHSYHSIVDLDRNNGIPDVASTLAIVFAALGAAVLATRGERGRVRFAFLTAVLALIAAADAVQAPLDRSTAAGTSVLAVATIAAVLLVMTGLEGSRWPRVGTLGGLALLAVAASGGFVYDDVSTQVDLGLGRGDVAYELGIVAKQGLELAGWTLIAVGMWAAVAEAAESQANASSLARLDSP